MSEIVVVGSLRARPGKEDALRAALADLVETTHAEEGCLLYAAHQGAEDPSRFAVIERWASREALDEHIGGEHLQAALAGAADLLAEAPDSPFYTALSYGEATKGSLAGAAG